MKAWLNRTAALHGGDRDVAAWIQAVNANGGAVSVARAALITTLVQAYKSCGWWDLMDDAALLVAENAPQALTSLKLRTPMTAVSAPTFTTDRGYAFNGSAQYVDTAFVPSTMATKMVNRSVRMSVYERANVGANTTSIGASSTGVTHSLRARNASNQFAANVAAGAANFAGVTDSRGLLTGQYPGVDGSISKSSAWQRGVALTDITGLTPVSTNLPAISYFIGGLNSSGSLSTARAATIGYADWGAPTNSTTIELAVYNALQTFMTAVGANV